MRSLVQELPSNVVVLVIFIHGEMLLDVLGNLGFTEVRILYDGISRLDFLFHC